MAPKDNSYNRIMAIVGLFVVAIIWGSTFTANKIVLNHLTPLGLMAIRFMLAFIVMIVIFRKKFIGKSLKDFTGGALCGIALFIAFIFQTNGLLYTDAGKQAFLSGSYVIVVPFLTWMIFKSKPSLQTYAGAALCFYGISLLSLNSDFSISIGDSLTLFSSIFFAAQIVIAGYFIDKEDPAVMSTVQFGVMGILSLIAVIFKGEVGQLVIVKDIFSTTSIAILYLGVVGTAVAYYLQILCQKNASPTTTSIVLSLEAVFGTIIAIFVLGDVFTGKMAIGAVLILASILLTEIDLKDIKSMLKKSNRIDK